MSRLRVNFSKLDPEHVNRILFDGDILTYTIGFAVEDTVEFPDYAPIITGDLPLAKRLIDNRFVYFTRTLPDDMDFKLVITGDAKNWRKELDPEYKAGRGRKPTDYHGIREHMRSLSDTIETRDGLEADDFLASEATRDPQTAIVSFDKDMFGVAGTFIHLQQNSSSRMYTMRPAQALCFLMFQAIAGDPVDHYKGVQDIGVSKAKQLVYLCELKDLTIRQAYLQLKSAIVKRSVKHGKPELWNDFRRCLDLASLTWHGEAAGKGIGLRRIWKYRNEKFEYFLPYYDPAETHKHTRMKL